MTKLVYFYRLSCVPEIRGSYPAEMSQQIKYNCKQRTGIRTEDGFEER